MTTDAERYESASEYWLRIGIEAIVAAHAAERRRMVRTILVTVATSALTALLVTSLLGQFGR